MCRRNQALGWGLAAFGLGVLIGAQLESGFLCSCVGWGVIILGFSSSRKK